MFPATLKILDIVYLDKVYLILHFILPRKFEISIFFGISPLFSWANTFKTQVFRPKIEYFQQQSKFCTSFILIKYIYFFTSSYHENLRSQFFLGFRQFFRGLTLLKLKNFDQKLNIFQQHSKFCISFILIKYIYFFTSSYHENLRFQFFLGFRHFFRGLTPLKL